MRPTILVNHLYEPTNRISGISRYLFSLLPELTKRDNFRYVLATAWTADRLPSSVTANGLVVRTCAHVESTPLNILRQQALIPRLIHEFACAAEFNCNSLGCFVPLWPRVITVHDLYMRTLPTLYPARHRLWWNLFFPATAHASQAIICVSRNTSKDVATHYPSLARKTAVVHEAGALVKTGEPVTSSLPGAPYGLFVGNVAPNKNVEFLVDAMRICEERGRPVTICHVGGDAAGILARAMAEKGLQNPVRSLGALADRQLSAAYEGAAFFVATSKQEGFCLPVVEAQECGTPVLCPDIPIFREVAGEGALYFRLGAPDELADLIGQVLGDERLRRTLSAASRRNAARFSWSRAAEETEVILQGAIAGRTAGTAAAGVPSALADTDKGHAGRN